MLVETGLMACASIQTQSIGFRRRLLALFTLAVSIGNASCILGVSSIRGTPPPQRGPLQDRIEVVITVKGQICTAEKLAGPNEMELNRPGGTCPPGVVPLAGKQRPKEWQKIPESRSTIRKVNWYTMNMRPPIVKK